MVPPTTRPTVGVLALLLLTAGCLSGLPAGTPSASTPTPAPDGTDAPPSPSGTPPTAYPDHERATNEPNPDHDVVLESDYDRSVTVHVRVIRNATNETVYDATHTLPPGKEQTVYNTVEADPDGVERFTVVTSARNATERVEIETSQCYGNVIGAVDEDGEFYLTYAIC
jgi:hypothetical protein